MMIPPPPVISVIIPMYNSEKYIETCIKSILSQTFQDFEIIVADDCSNDNSLEVVKKFNDPRIKIYRRIKNSGSAAASRNLGLINSTGQYVYFMDQDDAILPNCLEIFYKAIEKSNAEVVHMNSHYLTHNNDFQSGDNIDIIKMKDKNPTPRFVSMDLTERIRSEYLAGDLDVVPWKKISRRNFLMDHSLYFPVIPLAEDLFQFLGELCFAKKIQVIDACGYIYRQNDSSIMHRSQDVNFKKALESMPNAVNFIRDLLSSPNLIGELTLQFKRVLESEAITRYYKVFILDAYEGDMKFEQIDEIISRSVYESSMIDPKLMRILLHTVGMLLTLTTKE